jgi:hypothetical protein
MGRVAHFFGRTDQIVMGDMLKRLFEIEEILSAVGLPLGAHSDLIAPRTVSDPAAGTIVA